MLPSADPWLLAGIIVVNIINITPAPLCPCIILYTYYNTLHFYPGKSDFLSLANNISRNVPLSWKFRSESRSSKFNTFFLATRSACRVSKKMYWQYYATVCLSVHMLLLGFSRTHYLVVYCHMQGSLPRLTNGTLSTQVYRHFQLRRFEVNGTQRRSFNRALIAGYGCFDRSQNQIQE